ncbi:MAG: hypothetical protein B7Y75_02055 [Azorhizobium sp. 35-67-5]|nr:MAG: hypothetical protein B7Y75_02055 [Azorhizobium sp. 35-67-5]OZA84786.1 MAG: hypothetical protein B7X76_06145 [Azorhizobium sp. 39-67-5]
MTRLRIPLLALIVLPLAACDPSNRSPPTAGLPPVPADLRICLSAGPADVPDTALSVGEVERGWKQDRRTQAAVRRCGQRLAAWYDDLRTGWR